MFDLRLIGLLLKESREFRHGALLIAALFVLLMYLAIRLSYVF